MTPAVETAMATAAPGTAAAASGLDLSSVLLRGIGAVRRSQLPTGEVPGFFRPDDGDLRYRLCPLPSTLVHDALGVFDPTAPAYDRPAAARLAPGGRTWLLAAATVVRRRIRDFLAWQQDSDGRWRFFGRASGIEPDAATTACAAAALLEHRAPAPALAPGLRRSNRPEPWRRSLDALLRHRAPCGRFFTYRDRHGSGSGYGSLGPRGERRGGFDRVVNAHVLRFLVTVGGPIEPLIEYLRFELTHGDLRAGSPDHPEPLVFVQAVTRAWHRGGLGGRDAIAAAAVPAVVARLGERPRDTRDGGDPLATALGLHALLDLGVADRYARRLGRALRAGFGPAGWSYRSWVRIGAGSASLTTALAVSALGRLAGADGAWR